MTLLSYNGKIIPLYMWLQTVMAYNLQSLLVVILLQRRNISWSTCPMQSNNTMLLWVALIFDLMDRNMSNYRPKLPNNKWWWQIFVHLLSASVSNAWVLHRIQKEKKKNQISGGEFVKNSRPLDLLGFIRNILNIFSS